ncbi:hypothetical protein BUY49_01500 [Staphylococcus devriesei]|uniref:hypothetical protein n=1 Tax=Staphylococcus devriesei TaxID=586733 RepID=UPI000E67C972|nr:hypothetical protein [Staphylococcus devriesei]RIL72967.1 hypothetical protein BUY49_01500 [Staphylococcus devriesei]
MKIINLLSYMALVFMIGYIIYGVIMMIGQLMGLTEYEHQLAIVGLCVILLGDLTKNDLFKFITLAGGVYLVLIG